MKYIYYSLILIMAWSLFSCKEKTAETSKYKEYILQMDSVMNQISEQEKRMVDTSQLNLISNYSKEANDKFSLIQTLVDDSIMPASSMIDNAKLIRDYRGALIKGVAKNNRNKIMIDKELPITKKQYEILRENLVFETLKKDLAEIYVNIELNYGKQLVEVMEQYNLLNESALKYYESNTKGIDSLINLYVKDTL